MATTTRTLLLSFDIEEFDTPGEYGCTIPLNEQVSVSSDGLASILDILKQKQVQATFYCTAIFAQHNKPLVDRIIGEGHELASHGYSHSSFSVEDLAVSRSFFAQNFGVDIKGYRMARMASFDDSQVRAAGYSYNSSLNPTWLPGRYNNFFKPRTWFYFDGVLQLPASVTPFFRIPLFWLSFHVLPKWLLFFLCRKTINKDGYLNIYFHPWEFVNLKGKYKLPVYITANSGLGMQHRLAHLIDLALNQGWEVARTDSFLEDKITH